MGDPTECADQILGIPTHLLNLSHAWIESISCVSKIEGGCGEGCSQFVGSALKQIRAGEWRRVVAEVAADGRHATLLQMRRKDVVKAANGCSTDSFHQI